MKLGNMKDQAMFVDEPLNLHIWHELQRELRETFDRRDGIHLEVLMDRIETMIGLLPNNGDNT